MTITCVHKTVECINPYEFIRKYACVECHHVMMCDCEKDVGEKFLPHQLREGKSLYNQESIVVDLGFQHKICNSCRELPEPASPMAAIYGRTTKLKRYYWREIFFETCLRFDKWARSNGFNDIEEAKRVHPDQFEACEKEAHDEIRILHEKKPKYNMSTASFDETVKSTKLRVEEVKAKYIKHSSKKALIELDGSNLTVEEYATEHFRRKGFESLFLESRPFHVIFGTFMYLIVEDPFDPKSRIVGGTDVLEIEKGNRQAMFYWSMPSDFGTRGWYDRRLDVIDEHFEVLLSGGRDQLLECFDYWIERSWKLRNYLWARQRRDVATARKLLEIISPDEVRSVLRYLCRDYWGHYIGWPDLLVYNSRSYFFVEVKSSNDQLSDDQKRWLTNNYQELHFDVELFKIHRLTTEGVAVVNLR